MRRLILIALSCLATQALADPARDYLPPPLLGPPKADAYGPGVNADATGRPFHSETESGQPLTIEPPPKANAYGAGIDMDVYGRPVQARPNH